MEQGTTKNSFLLDATSVLAILLPILQITFVYLPESLKNIYLQQNAFLGVSLVTLLLSYVAIVAYKARPWFTFVFPFHKKKMEEYNAWQQKMYQASSAMNFVNGEQASVKKIEKFLKGLERKTVSRPFQINSENRIGILMIILFANSILFLVLGLSKASGWWATLQSISYFFLIIFAVLVLVIYRDTTNNNKRFNENLKKRSEKAINLAINNNCFTPRPTVKFISTHGGEGINNNFVRVEFENEQYEICTDSEANKLIYCYKLQKTN